VGPSNIVARILVVFCLAAVCAAQVASGNTSPGGRKAPLLNGLPQAVASGQAHALGSMDGARRLKLAVILPLRNQAQADALVQQIYDPQSPNYHHYLSVDEFTERFGTTQADYDTVVRWAAAQGLAVTNTTSNRHIVDIEGSVDAINAALNVRMTMYQHPAQNRQFFAPDREPTITLSVPVLQIGGLDNYTLPQPKLKRGTVAQVADAIAHGGGGSGPGGEFLPKDMRAAYYGSGPLTGAGQTVGIFSFDGYKSDDVQLFFTTTGTSSNVPINNVLVNGFSGLCGDGGSGCDDGEQVLDIVNVLGMAPGITQILFYEGNSGPDILNQMATDNLAKVLSCSWGSSDMGTANDPIFTEFQAQGQTFLNATGDNGAYNASTWLPPSLNSKTLQVGGTDLTTAGAGGPWASETAWSDSGGGFYSPAGYSIPSYQQLTGVINASNGGSMTLRNDPDVAAEGDFDNPTVSNGNFETGFGGTSFAAPRWAGFIALANEQSVANGAGTLGFVNPAIYTIGTTSAQYALDFHDITSGSNGHPAVAGYDLVTGWGSPTGASLIGDLAGSTTTPGYVLAVYPPQLSTVRNAGANTTVSVASINGFSNNVSLSASGLPSGVTALFSPSSTDSTSALTLSADGTASIGTASITITGQSGALVQNTTVSLLVGNPPIADITSSVDFPAVVPLGSQNQALNIGNAVNSVALTYSAAAYASTDGSCSGSVAWLSIQVAAGTVNGGDTASLTLAAAPSAASLTPGDYAAEVCVTTNDPAQPLVAVPVSMTVIQGPLQETIFLGGFETVGDGAANIVTFVLNQPVEDDQAGSALDLVTGNYHTWDAAVIDNINLYNDGGSGLAVYWYNDVLPNTIKNKVGGVTVGGNYAVLQPGATIGPGLGLTFSRTVVSMTTWWPGMDGFLGIEFRNNQTSKINYGYIHLQTSGLTGLPAQVLEYGFDNSGAAIRIP
jgi:Pro-kumamolisin, activation domain